MIGTSGIGMKVTTRIAAGYGVVVGLSIAIAFVGYRGTEQVNDNLSGVVNEALPMIDAAMRLESTLLKAETMVGSFHEQEKISTLDSIEKQYKQLKNDNEQAHKDLVNLATNDSELTTALENLDTSRKNMLESGDAVMKNHREALQKHQTVIEKSRMVKDMGDEIVGSASDLKSSSAVKLASMIDDTAAHIISGIDLKIKGAVLSKKKNSQNDLAEANKLMQKLGAGSLSKSEKFNHVQQSYQRLNEAAIGKDGLFDTRVAELDLIKKDQESLDNAIAAGEVVSQNNASFNQLIHQRTGSLDKRAKETVSNSQAMIIIFAAIAVTGSVLLAFYIIQSIRKPLEKIVAGVQQVADGDLRVTFESKGGDEFAQLARHMQHLSTNMRNIIGEINSGCIQLSATAEQTATISDISFKNVNTQKEETSMIATATEELTATVEEVAKSINNTLSEVEKVCREVKEGEDMLKNNVVLVKGLSGDVEHGAAVIQRLADDTNNIGSILDVITSVAEQTNLLALNAAIEAARAGEQGRGFAVVADEVRTLAARAQSSTAEIKDMIQRLQDGAAEAVQTMRKSRESSQHSVGTVVEAGNRLGQIAASMNNIRDMSLQIASASEEQTAVSRDQLRRITAIADVSEKNSDSARESNAASKDLARMAENQRSLISKFKV